MHSLAGIGLIRLHNANAMIDELVVGARQFDLGHMARDAVVFQDRTGFGFDLPAAMAGLGDKGTGSCEEIGKCTHTVIVTYAVDL